MRSGTGQAGEAAAKIRATFFDRQDAAAARARLQPVLDQIAQLEAALAPYEQIKADLTAARARYRKLTDAFVDELKFRCAVMSEDEKRALVLESSSRMCRRDWMPPLPRSGRDWCGL